jgi:transglutaminase-like putative cysteine protease
MTTTATTTATNREPQRAASPLLGDLMASVALCAFSIAVAAGFARVFVGWDFLDELVLIAVVGHGVSLALRLVRAPVWIAFPLTLLALVWTISMIFYRDSMAAFVPNSETLALFRLDLERVGEAFRTEIAPVPFGVGWDVLAAIGVGAAALLADTFAFRAFARAEALVPGGVLFVFVAALGTDRSRVASTMVLVGIGVVTTIALRRHHAGDPAHRIGLGRPSWARAIPAAAVTALSIALIAGIVGPRLPGAGAAPLYETKGSGSGSVTEIVSPLVDIRSRLTNRSDTELFTVQADAESYWRSSALAEFDGRTWGLPERGLSRTDGSIGDATDGSVTLRHQVRIEALGGKLLPAAADPLAASGAEGTDDAQLRYNPDSATLVKTGADLEQGDAFDIESASPRYSSNILSGATSSGPGDDIYLELPRDFPSSVESITREVTAGATSTYEVALSVQNWMRSEFEYSLDIQEGHGNSEIEGFLERRVGYCEQFAGTYAAMLRTIGIPTRVAVGFTSGSTDGQGNYSVLGRNAHAWPEVWFDGVGWVPFEPTPGRGAPNAQEYTGIAPQQDLGAGTEGSAQTTVPPTTVEAVDPTPADAGLIPPTTVPTGPDLGAEPLPTDAGAAAPTATEQGSGVPWQLLLALAGAAAVVAAPAIARRLRRSTPATPPVRLRQLWTRATAALAETGVVATADLTPAEAASVTASTFPVAARPMQSLAEAMTIVEYAPHGADWLETDAGYGRTMIESCVGCCRQVERAVTDTIGPAARIRRHFTIWR